MPRLMSERLDFETHLKYATRLADLSYGLSATSYIKPMLNKDKIKDIESKLQLIRLTIKSIKDEYEIVQIDNLIKELDDAREKMMVTIEKIMGQRHSDKSSQQHLRPIVTKGKLSCKIAPSGHGTNSVYRFLLAHAGHEKYMKTLPMSLFLEHVT